MNQKVRHREKNFAAKPDEPSGDSQRVTEQYLHARVSNAVAAAVNLENGRQPKSGSGLSLLPVGRAVRLPIRGAGPGQLPTVLGLVMLLWFLFLLENQLNFHGARYSRVSSLLASGSPMITSRSAFHRIFRPVSMEMRPKCPGMAE